LAFVPAAINAPDAHRIESQASILFGEHISIP
jgi:hypothetical protein